MYQESVRTTERTWLRKMLTVAIVVATMMMAMTAITLSSPSQADAGSSEGWCTGTAGHSNIEDAKANFEELCNDWWDYQSGFHWCGWSTGTESWQCTRRARN